MAIIGIGEIGSELRWRIANTLAGATAGAAAFLLVHRVKAGSLRTTEDDIV